MNSERTSQWFTFAVVAAIVTVAVVLRAVKLGDVTLWYDELQSVTHANRPFPLSFFNTLTYDCHPPLYALFLSLWMLVGRSDVAILLSSVLLSCAAVVALFLVIDRFADRKHAIVSAAVFAIHPMAVHWSHFARMYTPIMLLCILCFYANYKYFEVGRHRRLTVAFVVLAEFCIVSIHIAGFFFLSFIWLYFLKKRKANRETWRRWVRFHLLAGLLYIPPLLVTLEHFRSQTKSVPGLLDFLAGLSCFTAGPGMHSLVPVLLGAVIFVLVSLAVMLSGSRKWFWYGVVFMAIPFPAGALVSLLGKPIWQAERLFAFLTPFFAAGFAMAWFGEFKTRLTKTGTKLLLLGTAALMIWGTIDHTLHFQKSSTFAKTVQTIREKAEPDDLIVVATARVGWGVKWHLLGPDWDQSIREEISSMPEEVCKDLDASLCIRRKIKIYDRRTRGTAPRVAVAEDQMLDLTGEKRIWTVTRKRHNLERLVREYQLENKKKERYVHRNVELVLFKLQD